MLKHLHYLAEVLQLFETQNVSFPIAESFLIIIQICKVSILYSGCNIQIMMIFHNLCTAAL